MSFKIYDTQCTNVVLFPNCEINLPPQVEHQVSGSNPIDFGLGIPYYANEVFRNLPGKPLYFSNNGYFSVLSTQNATSEYVVPGWEPTNLRSSVERFLTLEGHGDILSSPFSAYKFFSQGNTQSIGSIIYFAKNYAATLGKTVSIKAIGPSYFNLIETSLILGVPLNMYETIQEIENLPKSGSDFWLFYCCSPNNPDGKIFNNVSDIPSNVDAVYFDGAYSYKHYVEDQSCFPDINSMLLQRPGLKWVNYAFSMSKAGLASLRLSYNILCKPPGPPINPGAISSFIEGTTLGFGLGLMNSAQCFIDYVNDNFDTYTLRMKNLIDSNRQKIIDSVTSYFSSKYPGHTITIPPSVYNVPYVWLKVDGVNVSGELSTMDIITKNGELYFIPPAVGSNNYCRISAMPPTSVVDEFVLRLS